MKAYKIEVLVIDFENTDEKEIIDLIENVSYISPTVKSIKGVEIGDWSDDHPLNKKELCEEEYKKIFK